MVWMEKLSRLLTVRGKISTGNYAKGKLYILWTHTYTNDQELMHASAAKSIKNPSESKQTAFDLLQKIVSKFNQNQTLKPSRKWLKLISQQKSIAEGEREKNTHCETVKTLKNTSIDRVKFVYSWDFTF